ncbi:MAG: DUF2231 domain-containing protein [Alicyclobacillus sp.]|nr:DUF2231 domain-containing protein [Alicyclobacillus sp.]
MTTLYKLFPPTIHPMVVHFTISILYLAALFGLVGLFRRRDSFWAKAFTLLLLLGILATLAAGLAGVISESYDTIPQAIRPMLSAHKRDGELTGIAVVIATAIQLLRGRFRKVSPAAWLFALVAVILVSAAGFLGGSIVYDHGLGILHVTRP